MWLLALLVIVFIIIVFVLGSYSAKGILSGPAPYPTATELAQNNQSSCGMTSGCKTTQPQGNCSSSAGCAAPVDKCSKPCRKHRKKCCNVCKDSSDDGFSTGIAFISTPAPF
jgi:hypothetical protein